MMAIPNLRFKSIPIYLNGLLLSFQKIWSQFSHFNQNTYIHVRTDAMHAYRFTVYWEQCTTGGWSLIIWGSCGGVSWWRVGDRVRWKLDHPGSCRGVQTARTTRTKWEQNLVNRNILILPSPSRCGGQTGSFLWSWGGATYPNGQRRVLLYSPAAHWLLVS